MSDQLPDSENLSSIGQSKRNFLVQAFGGGVFLGDVVFNNARGTGAIIRGIGRGIMQSTQETAAEEIPMTTETITYIDEAGNPVTETIQIITQHEMQSPPATVLFGDNLENASEFAQIEDERLKAIRSSLLAAHNQMVDSNPLIEKGKGTLLPFVGANITPEHQVTPETPLTEVQSLLQEIHDNNKLAFILNIYDPVTKEYVSRSFEQLTQEEKQLLNQYKLGLKFYKRVVDEMKAIAKTDPALAGALKMGDQLSIMMLQLDTLMAGIPINTTQSFYGEGDSGCPIVVQTYANSLEGVSAETPHSVFLHYSPRIEQGQVAIKEVSNGSALNVSHEGLSDLADRDVTIDRPNQFPLVSYAGIAGQGVFYSAIQTYLRTSPEKGLTEITAYEYQSTVESRGLELYKLLASKFPDFSKIPELIANGGEPLQGFSQAQVDNLIKEYAYVNGLVRIIDSTEGSPLKLFNAEASEYANAIDEPDIRAKILDLLNTLRTYNFISQITNNEVLNNFKKGTVISEARRALPYTDDPRIDIVQIQSIGAKLNVAGWDQYNMEVQMAPVLNTPESPIVFFVKVEGVEQYIQVGVGQADFYVNIDPASLITMVQMPTSLYNATESKFYKVEHYIVQMPVENKATNSVDKQNLRIRAK